MWTVDEITQYRATHVVNPMLSELYATEGLVFSEPWRRAEYLVKKLDLTMTDHDVLRIVIREQGKVAALNFLEELAIESYR